jgi:hypothetical protein|tara:strand:+ start:2112 stop:2435 length:324 start_codon:yes stop_codon:yes gene_type:complete
LLEFAEHSFALNKTDESGTSEREHLEQVERQTGIRPKELEGPDFPFLLSHIWSAFVACSKARTGGFSGANPLTYENIKSWIELTGTPLDPREVEAVKELDVIYIRTQ